MKPSVFLLLAPVFALLLSGCANLHPMGLSDETWERMTPDERDDAYRRQAEIDARNETARLEAEMARERQALELERQRLRLVDERRRRARYGDLLQCVVEQPQVRAGDRWEPVEGFAFEILRGEVKALELARDRGGYRQVIDLWVGYDETGQTVALCETESDARGAHDCARILGTHEMFREGVRRHLGDGAWLKARVRCDFAPLP